MDDFFNEMQLPFANSNEELETISSNAFKPLFDIKKFEIRSEIEKDKGIDFHIELKLERPDGRFVYTNFRFAIQLKATEAIVKNSDGSYSKQIELSNVHYLLNAGMPAYYVLYHLPSKTFYYENVNDFLVDIQSKEKALKDQESYSLRFRKLLDSEALNQIYDEVCRRGKFQRLINEKITLRSVPATLDDKISFDSNLNIIDDAEVRKTIESVGLSLLNKAKWKSIIAYHKKASGNIATTSLYNLILGMAHYYDGNMYEALKFLKDAEKLKSDLSVDMENHLMYFYTAVRYFFGIISEEEFEKIMVKLESDQNLGLYVTLEKAKKDYLVKMDGDAFVRYKKSIDEIINSPVANEHVVINAKRELLLYEGFNNNMEFVRQCCIFFAKESIYFNALMRNEFINEMVRIHFEWADKLKELHEDALNKNDLFSYYNSVLVAVKIRYHFLSSLKILIDTQEKAISEMNSEMRSQIEILIQNINDTVEYFRQVGHIENQAASLSLQYEILHFIGDFEQAEISLGELEKIINIYDSKELEDKLKILEARGTAHESFTDFIMGAYEKGSRNNELWNQHIEEMKKMDEDEKLAVNKDFKSTSQIHLFPIGFFRFPTAEIENVLEVLNVKEDVKDNFRQLFDMIIPVVNILNDSIECEGYANGKMDDQEFKSWQNVYRIRKYFYENKFYKFNPS